MDSQSKQRMLIPLDPTAQREIAQKLGVAPETVFRWLTGQHRPRRRRMTALAEALGKTPDELATELQGKTQRRSYTRFAGGQAAAAKRLGVHQPTLNRWMQGVCIPRWENLVRLAAELKCSPDDLLVELYAKHQARQGKDVGVQGNGLSEQK